MEHRANSYGIDRFPTDITKEYQMQDPIFGSKMQIFTDCDLPSRGRTEADSTTCCIYLSTGVGVGTLIHELFHGVHHILINRGMHIDNSLDNPAGEECHAYLLQYYFNELIKLGFFKENKSFSLK